MNDRYYANEIRGNWRGTDACSLTESTWYFECSGECVILLGFKSGYLIGREVDYDNSQ